MNPWTEFPDPTDSEVSFRIQRTPPKTALVGIITSDRIIGRSTHFLRNRTIPCEGVDCCQHCNDGYSRRWHGWVSCILIPGLEHVLFEFTADSSNSFKTYFGIYDTMRGCKFQSHRPSGKLNGRITIVCKKIDLQITKIPDAPNVAKLLCHLWNIKYNGDEVLPMSRPPFRDAPVQGSEHDGRIRA